MYLRVSSVWLLLSVTTTFNVNNNAMNTKIIMMYLFAKVPCLALPLVLKLKLKKKRIKKG